MKDPRSVSERLLYVCASQAKGKRKKGEPVVAAYGIVGWTSTISFKADGVNCPTSIMHEHWGVAVVSDVSVMIVHAMKRIIDFVELSEAETGVAAPRLKIITPRHNLLIPRMDWSVDANNRRQLNLQRGFKADRGVKPRDSDDLWLSLALASKSRQIRYGYKTYRPDEFTLKFTKSLASEKANADYQLSSTTDRAILAQDNRPLDWLTQVSAEEPTRDGDSD